MSKILYILDQNIEEGKTSGIIHKIRDKIKIWNESGIEVEVLSLYSFKLYDEKLKLLNDQYSFNLKPHGRYFTLFRLMYSTFLLILFFRSHKYDLIYMRQRPYMPFTAFAFRKNRVVMEINCDDIGEYKNISKAMYHYNNITRKYFYQIVYAFIGVTKELSKRFECFNKPVLTIANGINVQSYPIAINSNLRAKLCFIGSPGFSVHGIDKVLKLAKFFPQFDFEIIGLEGESTNNLTYRGYLDIEKAKKIVSQSDIGLCSLSFYLNGMDEACPLKSRQYLAQGLPIIYAYDDTDLTGDEDFSLKLPNTAENIDENLDKIKEFINRVAANESIRAQVRTFSLENLDTAGKERYRLEFFKSLIS